MTMIAAQPITIIYKWSPHDGQKAILRDKRRFNLINCGRRWGKTKTAFRLLGEVFLNGGKCAYFAPQYKYLIEFYEDFVRNFKSEIIINNRNEKRIKSKQNGIIEFWTLEDKDAGRSRKYHRVVIDEGALAAYLKVCWQEAIRPTLTDYKGDAWFFSTPKRVGFWRELMDIAKQNPQLWQYYEASSYQNTYLDPAEIDAAKRDLPYHIFAQEYLAKIVDFTGKYVSATDFEIIDYLPVAALMTPTHFTVDTAMTANKENDPTGILSFKHYGNVLYITNYEEGWWDPLQLRDKLFQVTQEAADKRSVMFLEPKANGKDVAFVVKKMVGNSCGIAEARMPGIERLSKEDRFFQMSVYIRHINRYVKVLKGGWNKNFIDSLAAFPDERYHDEAVDCITMAVYLTLVGNKLNGSNNTRKVHSVALAS